MFRICLSCPTSFQSSFFLVQLFKCNNQFFQHFSKFFRDLSEHFKRIGLASRVEEPIRAEMAAQNNGNFFFAKLMSEWQKISIIVKKNCPSESLYTRRHKKVFLKFKSSSFEPRFCFYIYFKCLCCNRNFSLHHSSNSDCSYIWILQSNIVAS